MKMEAEMGKEFLLKEGRGICGGAARAVKRVRCRCVCALLAAFACGGAALAQTVRDVRARQRWPWNNLVDIDYTIEGVAGSAGQADASGLYIRFEAVDPAGFLRVDAVSITPDPPLSNGTHRVTWDPGADGIQLRSTGVVCRAELRRDDPNRYLVIDLSGGPDAAEYPVSRRPGIPGWTDEYKTTKLVLRKVDPGTFLMGSPTNELGRIEGDGVNTEDLHPVTLTEPFYIGVFEVTQKQYGLVTGVNPSYFKGSARPVETVSYDDIRGKQKGRKWPASEDVDESSFMGKIRAKTGLLFDLPTEAQWEYACRAGTATALNNGKDLTDKLKCPELDEVACYLYHDGRGWNYEYIGAAAVGSYLPNAWGLYDMHGNVAEWCLDWECRSLGTAAAENPAGPETGTYRMKRGGSWFNSALRCRSADRDFYSEGRRNILGFRVACSASGAAGR